MATKLQYAQFAANVYRNSTDPINLVGIPSGWTEFIVPDTDGLLLNRETGFEARAYTNGSEIVISFAGTDTKEAINDILIADGGTGLGYTTSQVKQAAEFYTRVKQKADALGQTITATGHSLGGGLAALVGVFFDVNATTFDPAPFRAAAKTSNRNEIVDYLTKLNLPVAPALQSYSTGHLVPVPTPAGFVLVPASKGVSIN